MTQPENRIATADIRDLLPAAFTAPLAIPSGLVCDLSASELPALLPYEQLVMAALARSVAPRVVLEYGTGLGVSATVFAENTAADTRVVTVDLASKARGDYTRGILRGDDEPGRYYRASACRGKVEAIQIHPGAPIAAALSARAGTIDLVYIDGDHAYFSVRSDTEQALSIAAQDATFLWHDFYLFPDYVRQGPERRGAYHWLNELAASGDLVLYHIAGTYLVAGRRHWPRPINARLRKPSDMPRILGERVIRLGEF